jgi:hypothetical protein
LASRYCRAAHHFIIVVAAVVVVAAVNKSINLLFADQGPRIRPCPRIRRSEKKIGASGAFSHIIGF